MSVSLDVVEPANPVSVNPSFLISHLVGSGLGSGLGSAWD